MTFTNAVREPEDDRTLLAVRVFAVPEVAVPEAAVAPPTLSTAPVDGMVAEYFVVGVKVAETFDIPTMYIPLKFECPDGETLFGDGAYDIEANDG